MAAIERRIITSSEENGMSSSAAAVVELPEARERSDGFVLAKKNEAVYVQGAATG